MTPTPRRTLLSAAAGFAVSGLAALGLADAARAQTAGPSAAEGGPGGGPSGPWPNRPVRVIVPAPGGGGTADTLARVFAQEMEKRVGQRVLIDNRGGANGNIGALAGARSTPDGYTILWSWAGTLATGPALYKDLPFDPERDFEPVVLIGNVPNVLVVNKDLPIHSLREFGDYARAHPNAINFGSTGNGSSMHLAGELYKSLTGAQMVHVPYAAPAAGVTDLLAGRIQAMFNLITGVAPQARAGAVTPIAVLDDRRSPQLPDVPTTAELGMPGLVFGTWFGLFLPKGSDPALVARINAVANEILSDPAARARFEEQGMTPLGGDPARLASFLHEEIGRHAALVRQSGARNE
ncbi:Bug family tripartite tricarboxylate transporter substrate binding protein [Roseomonas populi]|uniref:Tripartite tricarboxylate transporter substrate binding protein n=1 Tax=Roseomonas populi TaxID=3121582 RepID=A0ABT1X1Q4_9PROT|nr:tripartite tricarboxylate transporter substrate binding protein [Roseomonas pecuniae]MCR0981669.1 tripartite tricarboxylate transporter substrate binding protein [Roseomonas pecuniae]